MNKQINLIPYFIHFAWVNLLLTIVVGIFLMIVKIDSTIGSTISFFGAAIFMMSKFVKDHERVPNVKESMYFSIATLLVSYLTSSLYFVMTLVIFGGLDYYLSIYSKISLQTIFLTFASFSIFYFLALWLFYSVFPKSLLKAHLRKTKKEE